VIPWTKIPARTRRSGGTKVMEPLRWALPPAGVEREVLTRLPDEPTDKPPLLFVHGLSHAAWCWDEHWMPAAAEHGWPCYAVSLRGHGGSGGHEDLRRWKLRDYEHDVMQTIIDLPAPPVLVGHSMGALIVRRIIARYAAAAAVLVTPAGGDHGLGIGVKLGMRKPGQLLRGLVGQPVRLGADDLVSDEVDPQTAQRIAARLTPESPLAQYEIFLSPRPGAAKAPVLVIGAGGDALVPVSESVRTARAYGTRAHIFRGLGHDPMLERRWRQPLDLMLEWLAKTL
jgi:pimeloyl-ACP methyl ester carboxylesterase